MTTEIAVVTPNSREIDLAGESLRRLSRRKPSDSTEIRVRIGEGEDAADAEIPASVLQIMMRSLAELSEGRAVALINTEALLSTKEAAEFLNVSEPSLQKLIESGAIPCRAPPGAQAVRFDDLMAFKHKDDEVRRRILEELTAEAQNLGLGY